MKAMFQRLKKGYEVITKAFLVILVLAAVVNLSLFFINKDRPHTTSVNTLEESRKEIYRLADDKELKQTKQGRIVISIYRASLCGMIGELCTNDIKDGDRNFPSSLFGRLVQGIQLPYANPPASGIMWVHNGLQQSGFIPKTYAATGIGFAALQPLNEIWKLFRDISYVILVIFLIISGFLIMFRLKINPQSVISIENTLPRLVIDLLMITFSFAIAGFLIDLMYVVTGLIVSIIGSNATHPVSIADQISIIANSGPQRLFSDVFLNGSTLVTGPAIFSFLPTQINIFLRIVVSFITILGLGQIGPVRNLLSGDLATAVVPEISISWVSWAILLPLIALFAPIILSLIVIFFTGLLVFFRIFFLLFSAYIRIIISVIFSPILLILEIIPGKNMFSKWIKALVADLILFPLVIVMIMVSSIIVSLPISKGALWQPPFLYGPNADGFSFLIAIGILYMIPDVAKMIRGLFGIKGSPLKFGFGTFFGGAVAAGGGAFGVFNKFSSTAYYAKQAGMEGLVNKLTTKIVPKSWRSPPKEVGTPTA